VLAQDFGCGLPLLHPAKPKPGLSWVASAHARKSPQVRVPLSPPVLKDLAGFAICLQSVKCQIHYFRVETH
jgi:hypothetical protein